jgi:hypothetical protein
MTQLSGAATQKEKVAVITKTVFRLLRNNANNSSYTSENHNIQTLISQTYLKTHTRFCIPNCDFHWSGRKNDYRRGTAVKINKGTPHVCVNLPPLLSAEATGFCMPIENAEMVLAAVHKSP